MEYPMSAERSPKNSPKTVKISHHSVQVIRTLLLVRHRYKRCFVQLTNVSALLETFFLYAA